MFQPFIFKGYRSPLLPLEVWPVKLPWFRSHVFWWISWVELHRFFGSKNQGPGGDLNSWNWPDFDGNSHFFVGKNWSSEFFPYFFMFFWFNETCLWLLKLICCLICRTEDFSIQKMILLRQVGHIERSRYHRYTIRFTEASKRTNCTDMPWIPVENW